MRFLERAAHANIKHITPTVVSKMELHAHDAVNGAEVMQDMVYEKKRQFEALMACLFTLLEVILTLNVHFHVIFANRKLRYASFTASVHFIFTVAGQRCRRGLLLLFFCQARRLYQVVSREECLIVRS